MAGTNTSKSAQAGLLPPAPVIILVRPQLGENIGMCARAMLNCAVTELRIVAPRDGWPNPDALTASSGAINVIEGAKIYATTAEAVADLEYVLATTARNREIAKEILDVSAATAAVHQKNASAKNVCGILFGPERTGLENDDVALADAILNIPLNPGFSSLNLAQAVLLVCHSWLSTQNPFHTIPLQEDNTPAPKGAVENLMIQLTQDLDEGGFFRSPDQRPSILRNLRSFFFRSGATEQEIRTFHGIFSCLKGRKTRT